MAVAKVKKGQAIDAPLNRRRSIATTERTLAVAENLLKKHGEKFTLNEVATSGRISMSSIYARFKSKEELVRAVQSRVLSGMQLQISEGLDRVQTEAGDLKWTVSRIVDVYAEAHAQRTQLIRAFHLASREDAALRELGKETFLALSRKAASTVLACHSEISAPNKADVAEWSIRIFIYALGSYLGYGYGTGPAEAEDWDQLKGAVTRMIVCSLNSKDT